MTQYSVAKKKIPFFFINLLKVSRFIHSKQFTVFSQKNLNIPILAHNGPTTWPKRRHSWDFPHTSKDNTVGRNIRHDKKLSRLRQHNNTGVWTVFKDPTIYHADIRRLLAHAECPDKRAKHIVDQHSSVFLYTDQLVGIRPSKLKKRSAVPDELGNYTT